MRTEASEALSVAQAELAQAKDWLASVQRLLSTGATDVAAEDLAKAHHDVEWYELRAQAAVKAAQDEQEQNRLEQAEAALDEFHAGRQECMDSFVRAAAELRVALQVMLEWGRQCNLHSDLLRERLRIHGGVGDRVRMQAFGPTFVDGERLDDVTTFDHLCAIVADECAAHGFPPLFEPASRSNLYPTLPKEASDVPDPIRTAHHRSSEPGAETAWRQASA